jgi:ABC-type cobalamin/Fe3+-siderophores transport system ATPase subunit
MARSCYRLDLLWEGRVMSEKAIVVEGVDTHKRFGDVTARGGIDFDVERGTVFGLRGPNGAGKTTAVRVLATVLRPDGGRAEVLGRDVARDADAVRPPDRAGRAERRGRSEPHRPGEPPDGRDAQPDATARRLASRRRAARD